MYLDTLSPDPITKQGGVGYQVFTLVENLNTWGEVKHILIDPNPQEIYKDPMQYGQEYSIQASQVFTCNFKQKWGDKSGSVNVSYNAGFHLWQYEKDAKQCLYWMNIIMMKEPGLRVIRAVTYAEATAEGYIDDCSIIVVSSIIIQVPESHTDAYNMYGNVERQLYH